MRKFIRQTVFKASVWMNSIGPKLGRYYTAVMAVYLIAAVTAVPAYAVTDIFTVARSIIIDVYNGIAGINTVLARLMSAVAVIGAKMSSNQHRVDQSWDWLKRIWIAWAIINGIGAFIAYIVPKFDGLATLEP